MIFGTKPVFAVELDIVQSPFGFARIWISGHGIGDYAVPSAVPSIVEQLLIQQAGRSLAFFSGEAEVVLARLTDEVYGDSPVTAESFSHHQYFFAPGYAPFDGWVVLMLPIATGIRFLISRNGKDVTVDFVVPIDVVRTVLEEAKKWIESNTNMTWTPKGFI